MKKENQDDDKGKEHGITVEEQILNTKSMSKKYGITIVLKRYNCIISDGTKEMHRKNEHVAVMATDLIQELPNAMKDYDIVIP